jgi:RND family efflux transporter MFP subunit
VDQGAVIAELDSGVEKAAVEFARLRSKLTAEIELRRASAAFGQRQQTRNRELFHKHAISAQDMDQLETETRLAHLQLRQAEDNQQLAALELRQAEEALKRRTIRSPVKGVVVERFKAVGEYVEDTPVLHIAQLDPLHVEVIAPVDLIGRIRNGMQAEVTPESPTTSSHHATVTRVDRVADPSSATFGIRLELPNTDYRIPAGLRCRLRFLPEVTGNPGQLAGTTSEPEETVPKAAATTAARETAPAIDQATAAPKQVASTTPNHAARSEP